MILHLITDEKFADYAIKQLSAFAGSSEFVLVQSADMPLRYVQSAEKVRIVRYKSEEYNQLLGSISQYACVLSHGLFEPWQWEIILACPQSVTVAWMFWGGEVYGLPQCGMRFLSPSARVLYRCKQIAYWLKGKTMTVGISQVPLSVFKRVDYCLTDEREECDFANQLLGTSMQHLWYNYYSIDETVGALIDTQVNGMNILLGNSSTFECNHLMIMRKIKSMRLHDQQLILPLSYGDTWLRERLLYIGKKWFGTHFMALTSFMPRDEYNRIMQSCGVVIMPHYRPQAFGNILTALWLGAKVFMSKKCIAYPFFKRLGVHFYTVENDLTQEQLSMPLSVDLVQHNRTILSAEYSVETMLPRINQLIEQLNA